MKVGRTFQEGAARYGETWKRMDVEGHRVPALLVGWGLRTGAKAEAAERFCLGRALTSVLGHFSFYPLGEA